MLKRTILGFAAAGTLIAAAATISSPSLSVSRAQSATATPATAGTTATPIGLTGSVEGNVVITETLPFRDEDLARLKVPDGFTVNVFARNLGNVRWMGFAPDGTLLVTRRREGDIIALTDADQDGIADTNEFVVVADNLPYLHGLHIENNRAYFATDVSVFSASVGENGTLSGVQEIVSGLPTGGQHPNRTLSIGPDGLLYITVGSTCNACDETDPRSATMLVTRATGGEPEVYAKGLRNTIGFAWHPDTGKLWGMDHGSDWRGDDQPPEELNEIVSGKNYGWPWCFAAQQPDLFIAVPPPSSLGRAAYCQQTKPAELVTTAHSAPIGFLFYTGSQFPAEYKKDAFVAMRGSWNREPPSGYKVVRIVYDAQGKPIRFDDFLTGFLVEEQAANIGRIAGMIVAPDGSLLIAEDQNGIIFRVSYTG